MSSPLRNTIQLQLALECVGLNDLGFLERIPGPDPDDIARVYAFRDTNGCSMFIRAEVPRSVKNQLLALDPEGAFEDKARVVGIFGNIDPCEEIRQWETYMLLDEPSPGEFPSVAQIPWEIKDHDYQVSFSSSRVIHVILQKGETVSSCISVRENDNSAECYVFTENGYRKRGYGRQVTASWAASIIRKRKIPFFSHARDNESSRMLAKSLSFLHAHSLITYV